jgi:hypothetical protein
MLMSPTRAPAIRRAALAAAVGGALGSAAVALALQTGTMPRDIARSGSGVAVVAYSDEALPGEGRPPSPGPTDPGGPAY